MRLRKKRHFDERFSNSQGCVLLREPSDFRKHIETGKEYYLDVQGYFGNDNPITLEIGCGKGGFIKELALANPDKNFLAVERISNVLLSAMESCNGIKNLGFINCDAQNLAFYLEKNTVQKILLNFSCPYPKKTYANRRLTNEKFLEIYKEISCPNFTIEQKTDSLDFFEYSLQEYQKCGYKIEQITYDLHSEGEEYEQQKKFTTEFEKKFVAEGKPINFVKVSYKNE